MKAKYQTPAIEGLLADGESILNAASLPSELTQGQNLNNAPETEETSGNLSRLNIWNDDEE